MKKIILASHGSLAEGMKSAAVMILGNADHCEAYGLDTYGEPTTILEQLENQIAKEEETQFIVLTDINGGSVQNQMMQLCNYPNVYVQTGMCLSMVLEVMLAEEEGPIAELMEKIRQSAKENMLGFFKDMMVEIEEEELW